jgi:ribosomal protein S27AE
VVFLSYPCPECGAAPGEDCTTVSGRRAGLPHAERTRHADRCPRCGVIVGAEEPGQLCERCALVRSLEIERATHWRRRDPD